MNDNLFHSELALALSARTGLAAVAIREAQAAQDVARPLITVSGSYTPYGASFRKGEVMIEIRVRSGDEGAAGVHSALATAVVNALTVDKGGLKSSMGDECELLEIGPKTFTAEIDGEDLLTVIVAVAVWRFV